MSRPSRPERRSDQDRARPASVPLCTPGIYQVLSAVRAKDSHENEQLVGSSPRRLLINSPVWGEPPGPLGHPGRPPCQAGRPGDPLARQRTVTTGSPAMSDWLYDSQRMGLNQVVARCRPACRSRGLDQSLRRGRGHPVGFRVNGGCSASGGMLRHPPWTMRLCQPVIRLQSASCVAWKRPP